MPAIARNTPYASCPRVAAGGRNFGAIGTVGAIGPVSETFQHD